MSNKFKIDTVRIQLIKERQDEYDFNTVTSASDAYELFKDEMLWADKEYMWMACFDAKGKVLNRSVVSIGTLTGSMAEPREMLKAALLSNACSVIISHNHPSGVPEPSSADIEITKRLALAARFFNIRVLDHIIIASGREGEYYSMAEHLNETLSVKDYHIHELINNEYQFNEFIDKLGPISITDSVGSVAREEKKPIEVTREEADSILFNETPRGLFYVVDRFLETGGYDTFTAINNLDGVSPITEEFYSEKDATDWLTGEYTLEEIQNRNTKVTQLIDHFFDGNPPEYDEAETIILGTGKTSDGISFEAGVNVMDLYSVIKINEIEFITTYDCNDTICERFLRNLDLIDEGNKTYENLFPSNAMLADIEKFAKETGSKFYWQDGEYVVSGLPGKTIRQQLLGDLMAEIKKSSIPKMPSLEEIGTPPKRSRSKTKNIEAEEVRE